MNRLLVIFLLIGSSSALKGQRNRLRRIVEEGDIVQENGLPKAEKVEKVVKDPKEPKKEKKVKTCKKIPKAVTPPTGDGSATTSQLTLPGFLGGGDDEEDTTTTTIESPSITTNSSLPPPPPPPDVTNQDGLTNPLPPGPAGPDGPAGEDAAVVPDEEDLPWCPAIGKKARSQEYCASLLAGNYPDHKSVKGEVQFDVMYDESEPAVLEGVKDKIKKKAARKVAGCKDNRRHRRRVQESGAATDTTVTPPPPPPPMENIYISGVKFGEFDVTDKCDSHDSMDGCDKVTADVEILYEAPDNREVTEEEAELLFMEVMQSIQLEGFEGAVVDNLSAEVQGSNRRVSGGKAGAIAGGTLAAAAVVAGVAVYKRYGNDIAAKWG